MKLNKHIRHRERGLSTVEIGLGISLITIVAISMTALTGTKMACVINKVAAGIETGSISFDGCVSAAAADPNMCPSMCQSSNSQGCLSWTGPYPRDPVQGCRHAVTYLP